MIKLPELFNQRMSAQLSDRYEEFLNSLQLPVPVSLRINPAKSYRLENPIKVPWSDYGRYLQSRPSFTLDPFFHAGCYYVQEASSMFLEQALSQSVDLSKSLRILDVSAAPGGKATHVLSLISSDSLLVANEVIRSRASILSENVIKWGYPNCIVTNNDPADFKSLENSFDVIVLDAPCSGEGLFRKDPQAMSEWSEQHIDLCASRQRRIVSDIWDCLKKDGILIYSTCTYNEKENEDNLVWLSEQFDAEWVTLQIDPSWGIQKTEKGNITGYRFYPHQVQGEGFFISVVRKNSGSSNSSRVRKTLGEIPKKTESVFAQLIQPSTGVTYFRHDDHVFYLPETQRELAELVRGNLRIVHAGTRIATTKHDKIIPEHSLALSIELDNNHFNKVDVSFEDALRFLRRENMQISLPSERGFYLVTYENIPLGWINNLGNRYNSLYPVEWRIRMN